MNNNKHTIEDFLLDESFRDWALDRDEVNKSAWRQWIKVHPEAWDMIEDACYLLQNLEIQEIEVKQEEIDKGFEEIAEYYDQQFTKKETNIFNLSFAKASKIAAAALIFILAGVGLYQFHTNNNTPAEYMTRTNEVKEIQLPDGSNVILNENSKLAFNKNWEKDKIRKVTLKGEAYFNVSKKAIEGQQIKFVVHSGDVKVEVLGTKFNINSNEQHTMVVLNSGKIRLTAPNESLSMKPGDVVEYQTGTKSLIRKKGNSNRYTAWTNNINKNAGSKTKESTEKDRKENLGNDKGTSKNTSSAKSEEYVTSENISNTKAGNTKPVDNKGKTNTNPDKNIQGKSSSTKSVASGGGGGSQAPNSAHYILHNLDQSSSNTSNQSEVYQQGNNNNAYIEQIGEGLKSKQVQIGNSNTASAEFEGSNIRDETDEFEWSTYQYQEGEGNLSSFELMETYNSTIYSTQKGNENISKATVNGEENILIILQEGWSNEVNASQSGNNNKAGINPDDPGIKQQGDFNKADIMQKGNNNTIEVNQQGNNNKTNINQNGNKNF